MAVYGRLENPLDELRRPPTGPPVPNMGGIVRTKQPFRPSVPYVAPPALGGVPGPAPTAPISTAPPPATAVGRRRGGGGGASRTVTATSAVPPSMASMLEDYVRKSMSGEYDTEAISRGKAAAKSASEGQRGAAMDAMQQDLASRGLLRSGLAARGALDLSRGAGSDYTKAVADIMNQQAETGAARQQAGSQVGLGLRELQVKQEEEAANRAAAARAAAASRAPQMFTYVDPETGESYELPIDVLG